MVWNDTADFLASSREPWFSTELWIGKRSPLTPVVLKVLGGDLGHYVTVQAGGCRGWAALAASVGSVVAPGWRRGGRRGRRGLLVHRSGRHVGPVGAVRVAGGLALALAVAAGVQVAARPTAAVAALVAVLAVAGPAGQPGGGGGGRRRGAGAGAGHPPAVGRRRHPDRPGRRWPPR